MTETNKQPQGSGPQASEAQIASHWREEEFYPPPPKFVEQANAKDPAILDRFKEAHFPDCFKEYADLLAWDKPVVYTMLDNNQQLWLESGSSAAN